MPILRSLRFAGDGPWAVVAAGQLLAAPDVAPVLSSGPAVAEIRHSLIDLGYALPTFGADGGFGPETGGAVARYRSERRIFPAAWAAILADLGGDCLSDCAGPANGRHSHGSVFSSRGGRQ